MKRYYTKTGRELYVIQGGPDSHPPVERPSEIELLFKESIFWVPPTPSIESQGPVNSNGPRYAAYYSSQGIWLIDDKVTGRPLLKEYHSFLDVQSAVETLNKKPQGA